MVIPLVALMPLFARSLNGPSNVAPACSSMTSPGWAASIAACRLPPAFTMIVAAALVRGTDQHKSETQPDRDHSVQIDTLLVVGGTVALKGKESASGVRS